MVPACGPLELVLTGVITVSLQIFLQGIVTIAFGPLLAFEGAPKSKNLIT